MNDQSVRLSGLIFTIRRGKARCLHLLAAIVACVAINGSNVAAAGTNVWTTTGPYGGQIRSVAIDPVVSTTVYAAGFGGVFKSTNGGATWAPASAGIFRGDQRIIVNAVVVSPSNRETLFAAEISGAYKSIDGGASWARAGDVFIGSKVEAIAIDPTDVNKIYLSSRDGIYRSVDGGSTWLRSSTGLNGTTPYSIAIAPGALYTGTSNGVFKSVDGGVTWATANVGFVLSGSNNFTFSVVVDAQTPTTVYANPRGQMYKSVDSGANWTPLGVSAYYFAVDAQSPNTLYAGGFGGVSKSINGGASWTKINTGLAYTDAATADVLALAVDSRAGGGVFVGTEGGVFRSSNGGNAWAASNTGLANIIVNVVAIDPLTPTTIYAGTRNLGVFKSTDGGVSWINLSNGLNTLQGSSNWVLSLAIDPVTPTTIYAGTNYFVYKSIDAGATWKPSDSGDAFRLNTPALAINPLNPQIIVAGTLNGGIYRSINGGASFTTAPTGLPNLPSIYGLSFGTKAPQSLWAFVQPGSFAVGVYMNSLDSGATWSPNYAGLDPSKGLVSVFNFLHTTAGVKSVALGYDAAFTPPSAVTVAKGLGLCNPITSVLIATFPTLSFAQLIDIGLISDSCGVSQGVDDGSKRSATNSGSSGAAAKALVFTDINAGLPNAAVKTLTITPTGDTLYAGLDGGSVYRMNFDNKQTVMTEFYNPSFDYYFITSRASNVALLDTLPAWRRTGKTFNVYIAQEPGTLGISRYYFDQIAVNKTRGSHFYTLVQSEKDVLASFNPGNTQTPLLPYNEGIDSYAFAPVVPGVGGSCAAGQTPVFRLFRGQARFPDNPNHRFTTDIAIYNSFIALGWDGEGVKLCVPS